MTIEDSLIVSMSICIATFVACLFVVRSARLSLGLPIAYLGNLYLNHVPGAFVHYTRLELFYTTPAVAIGIWHTAISGVCFLIGVAVAQSDRRAFARRVRSAGRGSVGTDRRFWLFCLIGGWIFVYALSPLSRIPTLGALIEKGGAIWMLGVLLGLRAALGRSDYRNAFWWFVALSVYPTLMLLLGGFLSYGSAAAIIVMSALAVSTRSVPRVALGTVLLTVVGLSVFVNYFVGRAELRSVLWSGAGYEQRVDAVLHVFDGMEFVNINNDAHADALDQRLNQNYFVGLAAQRLEAGDVVYREGASLYEAVIAVIPRAIWPDKPVFGGSGTLVRDMTGLNLSLQTSWGVGQVMEFYINFGWFSLVAGFLILGWLIGRLDIHAAVAEMRGDVRTVMVCFLPSVALIQPIGSMVEIVGGAAAAYVIAIGWMRVWDMWRARSSAHQPKV